MAENLPRYADTMGEEDDAADTVSIDDNDKIVRLGAPDKGAN